MKATKVISTRLDSLSRLLVKILRLGRSDVQEILETSPAGTDANPIAGMIAITTETSEKGKSVVLGYINKNRLAAAGEVRHFSQDGNGGLKFYTWLKANGTLELGGSAKHLARYEELETGFNQLKTDFNNFIIIFNGHIHATPSGPASPTATLGTASTASIAGAKINEIKTL